MAVREFNGTTDNLIQGVGSATSMTFGTVAMLLKFSTVTSFRSLFQFHNSSGAFVFAPLDFTNFGTFSTFYSTGSDTGFSASAGIWYLMVIRKATGTSTPRYSLYNYTAASWTHGNSTGGAEADATATGAGGRSGFSFQGTDDFFGGRVAARAAWANTLPWTADASGDTALAASGLKDAASSWLSNSPSVFWLYNQASTATSVDDVSTGGTGTQISITGTTVIADGVDDPPGFNFALTGTAAPTVSPQRWPAMGNWPRQQQQLFPSPAPGATTSAAADVATATGTAFFDSSGGSVSLNLIADSPVVAVGTAYNATVSTANTTNAAAQLASGTGVAQAPSPSVAPVSSVATGTGTGNNPSISTGSATNASAAAATATGTANQPTQTVATGASAATAAGAAQTATSAVAPSPSAATGTGAAQTAAGKVSPSPTVASGTGTANAATVQTGSFTNASAGVATGTGVAQQASGKISPTPTTATATGVANAASAGSSVSAQAGLASATGTANGPSVARGATANAGVATGTGTVNAAKLGVMAAAEAAAGLAVALTPVAGAFLPGTAHAATGTAPTATGVAVSAAAASSGLMTVPTATGG